MTHARFLVLERPDVVIMIDALTEYRAYLSRIIVGSGDSRFVEICKERLTHVEEFEKVLRRP